MIKYPGRAKGKLVAESGMAISNAKFMIQRHDGSVITAVTNESGDFDVDTLLPGEPYSITLANLE